MSHADSTLKRIRAFFRFAAPFAVAVCAQSLITYATLGFVAPEDISESARSPYWLSERTFYDGASSNIGWYALLMAWYKVVGFSFVKARIFRVLLHCISLLSLWSILRRIFGKDHRKRLVVFLALSISPTWLYYNTALVPNGTDLQFFPIVLWLLLRAGDLGAKAHSRYRVNALLVSAGFTAMFAALCYPTFLFFFPVFILLIIFGVTKQKSFRPELTQNIFFAGVGALLPLLTTFSYLKDPARLIWDPVTNSGLFRGGASAAQFQLDSLFSAIQITGRDLFVEATSYNYYLPVVEFSGLFGLLSFLAVLVGLASVFPRSPSRQVRITLALLGLLTIIVFIVPNLSASNPGIRRCTPLLVAFYGFYVLVWSLADSTQPRLKWGVTALLLLLPLHHVWALGKNYAYLKNISRAVTRPNFRFADTDGATPPLRIVRAASLSWSPWFLNVDRPEQAIANVRQQVLTGIPLSCPIPYRPCKFDRIFGALRADDRWNRDDRLKDIRALDPKTGKVIPLSLQLWLSNEIDH